MDRIDMFMTRNERTAGGKVLEDEAPRICGVQSLFAQCRITDAGPAPRREDGVCVFDPATVLVAFWRFSTMVAPGVVHTRTCPMHPDRSRNKENTTKKEHKCARVT